MASLPSWRLLSIHTFAAEPANAIQV